MPLTTMRLTMKRGLAVAGLTATLSGLLLPGRAQRSDWKLRYLETEKDALILQPPQFIADHVQQSSLAPGGRYAVALCRTQSPITPEQGNSIGQNTLDKWQVILWNRARETSRPVWNAEETLTGGQSLSVGLEGWIPGTSTVILRGRQSPFVEANPDDAAALAAYEAKTQEHLLWVNAASGTVRQTTINDHERLDISPTRPLAVLLDSKAHTLSLLDTSGGVRQVVNLPDHPGRLFSAWTGDGGTVALHWLGKREAGKPTVSVDTLFVDPQTGAMTPQPASTLKVDTPISTLDATPEPKESELQSQPSASTLLTQGKDQERVRPLWVGIRHAAKPKAILIAADASLEDIARSGDAVLYRMQESLWVAPLERVSKEQMAKALRARQIANAKQIGLGLLMYVQDYDETFPFNGGDINAMIGPYIKDDSVFEGFSYLADGNGLAGIDKPAEMIVGTMTGPAGIINIYADGHVKLKPN